MTADVLGGEPIYDQLMDRMLAGGKVRKPKRTNKVLIEGEVYFGAFMEGKPLSEIDLPTGCLVVSIQRDNKEIVPGGDTVLEAGDKLTFLCNEVIAGDVQKEIDNKCKKISL